jgi:5-methylcytosine-specific restriction enzyme subunit McrC
MVKEASLLRGTTVCEFDELTADVLHNQILKSTLEGLARAPAIDSALRHDLRVLARRFVDVSSIRLSASCFRGLMLSRNNREYIFLMRLCQFIHWSVMPTPEGEEARFQEILEDEVRMSAVFEEFLRNFYQLHCTEYKVRAEAPEWCVEASSENDLALLPRMVTDITLRHETHTLIIDAKFYKKALAEGPYGERVRSQHLYQLVTYLQNERLRHPRQKLAGMLIYPQVGRCLTLRYRLLGVPVRIATVDLGANWPEIEGQLHALLNSCAEAATDPEFKTELYPSLEIDPHTK